MKSQVKASAQRSRFASRSWRRFSPTSVDARLRQRAHVLDRHVLGRGQDLDVRAGALPDALEVGAGCARPRGRGSGRASDHASSQARPAWRPVRSPSRRWEKKSSGSQLVQSPADLDLLDPGLAPAGAARPPPGRASGPRRHLPEAPRRRRAPPRRPRSSTARCPGRSRPPRRRPPRPPARRSRPPARASRSGSSRRRPGPRARPAGSRRRAPRASARRARSPARRPLGAPAPAPAKALGSGASSRA